MSKQRLRTLRLQKEWNSLQKQPIENAFVKRVDDIKFYFCLYNLEDDFKGGFYFGLLQLHPQYPFAAPKLFMYTPNGRFQQDLAICTSFTNYHQQSWTSAWNVRSLIQATISFMYSNEPSYGCRADSLETRRKYAIDSYKWNMKNQLFVSLFGQEVKRQFLKMSGQTINKNEVPKREIYQHDNELKEPLINPNRQQNNQNPANNNQRNNRDWKNKAIKIIGGIGGVVIIGSVIYIAYSYFPEKTNSDSLYSTNPLSKENSEAFYQGLRRLFSYPKL